MLFLRLHKTSRHKLDLQTTPLNAPPCGDRAGPIALAAHCANVSCASVLISANPPCRSRAPKRSRCGAAQTCLDLGELSAEIARVEALSLPKLSSLCSRANLLTPLHCAMVFGSCLADCASAFAIAWPRARSLPGPRHIAVPQFRKIESCAIRLPASTRTLLSNGPIFPASPLLLSRKMMTPYSALAD